ncbi:MAG TPA: FMN-binding protein [Opitutaceae bacterium]
MKPLLCLCLLLPVLIPSAGSQGEADGDVYQAPEAFIAESFDGAPPAPSALWLSKAMRDEVKAILGHEYAALRVRYWRNGARTAWILDEIGKVKPITTGIVVLDGRIERLKVLVYRESHGWEVKHPFFTERFRDATLTNGGDLSRPIDNIAGATLSVNALKRLAALALYLDRQAQPARAP